MFICFVDDVKTLLEFQKLRQERRNRRTAELIEQDKQIDNQMQEAAIQRASELDTTAMGKYSIWRKEYESPNSDSTVKLMRDQIIMAKAYASIAKAKNESGLFDSLIKHSRKSQLAIGEANSDAELQPRYYQIMFLLFTFISVDSWFLCWLSVPPLIQRTRSGERNGSHSVFSEGPVV